MRKFVPVLVALVVLGFPQVALAQESASGLMEGQVINGTEGGSSVAQADVVLIPFIKGVQGELQTTKTDDQGRFQFDQLVTDYDYLLLFKHMEVDYYYQVFFLEGEEQIFVEMQVFDSTTSDQAIRVKLAHVIMRPEKGKLGVTQVFWLENSGDRAYVGEREVNGGTLVFGLPAGATDFAVPGELIESYRLMADRVIYDEPFIPGEKQLDYSYQLAIPGSGECAVTFEVNYPVDEFHVMVGDEECEAISTELSIDEPIVAGDGQYFIHLAGENIAPGTIIDVNLANLASGGVPVVAILVPVIAVIAVIAAYLVIKKRPWLKADKVITSDNGIEARRRRLQQELAQLDDDFKQGLISEDIFKQARSDKEIQLDGLRVRKEGGNTNNG